MAKILENHVADKVQEQVPPVPQQCQIAIEPFKRTQYDRGTKKVMVDGEQWGWIEMASHGSRGPTYHAHDMHGPVMVKRGIGWGKRTGEPIEASFSPKGQRAVRIENISRSSADRIKPVSTDIQLLDHVRELIEQGYLRAPDVRDQEIADDADRYRKVAAAVDRKERENLEARAQDIVFMIADGKPNDVVKAANHRCDEVGANPMSTFHCDTMETCDGTVCRHCRLWPDVCTCNPAHPIHKVMRFMAERISGQGWIPETPENSGVTQEVG